jgi:2-succinyl-6-hydroxy-2,4-cyclohexadiene-1-carboxylate synthase
MPPDRLHVERHGRGRPVVLVHGFTQTGRSWTPIGERLAHAGHEVVTVDAPGHGASGHVRADVNRSADLLCDAASGRASAYVGYSMGGRMCLHLALRHPDVVERLVLIGATAGIDDTQQRAIRRAADETLAEELEGGGDQGVAAFIDRWLAGPLFAGLTPAAADRQTRLTHRAAGLAASLRLAGTGAMEPVWDRLHELAMPVLILAGERDAKFADVGQRMVAAIGANARLTLIADATHAAHLERPTLVAGEIIDFLR